MKKTLLYLFAITLVFASCKKDDDAMDTDDNEANIVGTWKITSETENGVPLTLDECEVLGTINFRSNGTATDTYYYGENCAMTDVENYNYSINDDQLTISYGDNESYTVTITTLNNTTLKIEDSYEEEGVTYTYSSTYTKQ